MVRWLPVLAVCKPGCPSNFFYKRLPTTYSHTRGVREGARRPKTDKQDLVSFFDNKHSSLSRDRVGMLADVPVPSLTHNFNTISQKFN